LRSDGIDRSNDLADLDGFPLADGDAQDLTSQWARYANCRFVGLELEERLLKLDHISNLNVDLQDIAGLYTFAHAWQFDFSSHGW
jgi:hypothetical protein